MATSNSYYGLRRGSTKSHTYSVVDGKQITKDRVEGGKNPRTLAQMTQRCIVGTIGSAYSAMKSICDHSFEGKTAGMQCMREFNSKNMKLLRIAQEYDNGFFGFIKYQQPGLVPGSYVISDGSLPDALVDAEIESVDVTNKKITLTLALTSNGTIAEVADAMGCKNFNDICTVAIMYPKSDGSYGFGAVRFTYMSGATVLGSFAIAVTGDTAVATPTFTSNTLKVEVRMSNEFATSATAESTYMAAITSRKVNGNWLRSSAQFDVTDAVPTFAQAISTYPVGQERFLNGSAVDVASGSNGGGSESGSGGSGSGSGSGSITTGVAAPTIGGEAAFTTSTQVTMSGPDGAEIRYTTDGSTPTASSTLYTEAITVSSSVTLKAIAIKDGQSSEVTTKQFVKSDGGADDPSGFEGA